MLVLCSGGASVKDVIVIDVRVIVIDVIMEEQVSQTPMYTAALLKRRQEMVVPASQLLLRCSG
jgi:hypothetical protein